MNSFNESEKEKSEYTKNDNDKLECSLPKEEQTDYIGQLVVPFGTDSKNNTIYKDLSAIPHMLVSGTTGSGKTSFVQSIMASLMLNHNKDEVQFVIFDSKGFEYKCFSESNYLFLPIVYFDSLFKDVLTVINRWANISYHSKEAYRAGTEDNPAHIFVIIDDFASLNMDSETHDLLSNILKNGRNAGVHCILITSIATADIVSTELKANITCRISFRVTSKQISRIVIDENGAESLKVPGEMIAKFYNETIKCQSTYYPYEEIQRIVSEEKERCKINQSFKKQSNSNLNSIYESVLSVFSEDSNKVKYAGQKALDELKYQLYPETPIDDSLYEDAKKYVIEEQKASTPLLQRRFGIGYNQASRIIDRLENNMVIGPASGSKPRNVLICNESYQNSDKINKPLRPFEEITVSGGRFSISNNEIHLFKRIKTKNLPLTVEPSFGSNNIVALYYKKPRFGTEGYFDFGFNSLAKISKKGIGSEYVNSTIDNISDYVRITFSLKDEHITKRFMKQISEDIGIELTEL